MQSRVPASELKDRLARFRKWMDGKDPDWQVAVIFGKINQYYFSGTMQDGLIFIPRIDEPVYWVRRSYERARSESYFSDIRPMQSFRDAAKDMGQYPGVYHIETEIVPIALAERFRKHFPVSEFKSLDPMVARTRAEKSRYEIELMSRSGEIHRRVLEDRVPDLLYEGMSEADLGCELHSVLIEEGHHGIIRFAMFETEIVLGQIAFGVHSIAPTYFNGPGGSVGLSPAVPLLGSRERNSGRAISYSLMSGAGMKVTRQTKLLCINLELPFPKMRFLRIRSVLISNT